MRRLAIALLVSGMLFPNANGQTESDGPGRGVARLSLLNGDVSVRRGDTGDWVAAAVNAPLLVEDRVFAAVSSRAEVQLDYFHRIRLAADTEVRITELESRRYQLQLARGTATFTALKGGDAQVEINTPGAAIRPIAHGNYRITVLTDGSTEITVRSGEAEVFTPKGSHRFRPGRTMIVRNDEAQYVAEIPRDSWDEFNQSRDKELARRNEVYRYVSRDIYGAEDLYGNGVWVDVPPYGMVWRPYVAPGWAPYRHGRWTWLDWYGWSWVSYDPWGWAPFHYGRWFWGAGGWCWYPGSVYGRHWWRPGLVAWFGWGGFGVGVGFGNWGWVPLAPFEPFYPWYGRGWYGGYRGVNVHKHVHVVNNVNIYNNYRNARIDGSVTTVNDLSRGAPGRALRGGELERASLMQGGLPVAPARESLRLADREGNAPRPTREDGTFYSRREVARVDRVPFESQRQALDQYTRQAAGDTGRGSYTGTATRADGERSGWRAAPPDSRGSAAEASRSTADSSGWRSFGEPRSRSESEVVRSGAVAERSPDARSETRSGWRSFGEPEGSTAAAENNDSGRSSGVWRSTAGSIPGRSSFQSEGGRSSTSRSDGASTRSSEAAVQPAPARGSEWSTGRGSGDASRSREANPAPAQAPSRGSDWSTGRGSGDASRGRDAGSAAPSRSSEPPARGESGGRSRGNDSAGFYLPERSGSAWSTGGGWSVPPAAAPAARSSYGAYGSGGGTGRASYGYSGRPDQSYGGGPAPGAYGSYGGTGRSSTGYSSDSGMRSRGYSGGSYQSYGGGGFGTGRSGGSFGSFAGGSYGLGSGGSRSSGGFGGTSMGGRSGGFGASGASRGGGGGFSGGTGRSGGGGRSR